MKFYKVVLVGILFLFCIGGVCATDTDNTEGRIIYSDTDNIDSFNTVELDGNVNIENSEDCDEYYINASDFTLNYGTPSIYTVRVYDYKGNPVNEGG